MIVPVMVAMTHERPIRRHLQPVHLICDVQLRSQPRPLHHPRAVPIMKPLPLLLGLGNINLVLLGGHPQLLLQPHVQVIQIRGFQPSGFILVPVFHFVRWILDRLGVLQVSSNLREFL